MKKYLLLLVLFSLLLCVVSRGEEQTTPPPTSTTAQSTTATSTTAGSTANWGYRAIKNNAGGKYDTELKLVKELSDIIDKARETIVKDQRIAYYADALDIVMKLAVELPTYQRSDLFAYNTKVIDVTSLTPIEDLTPYNGPMSKIWEVSLNETGK